jgi:selenide,water dikinase
LNALPRQNIPEVLVGYQNSDDAGVFQLTTDIAVVQTIDYFPPIVDDPFQYGAIAAANALSDIYAMGGQPKTALCVAGFPVKTLDAAVLSDIMRGGLDKLNEAEVALLGGHTVRDEEVKFGYAVTGIIDPKNIKQNSGAVSGDRIILTKPLGTGLITTALKQGKAAASDVEAAVVTMLQLNRTAAETAVEFRVHAMTDVTGFGLIGHALEVAKASRLSINLQYSKIPLLPGTLEYSRAGLCAGGLVSNREFFGKHVFLPESIPSEIENVLYDPQTSGGLLIFCPAETAGSLIATMRDKNIDAVDIGVTASPVPHLLTVT